MAKSTPNGSVVSTLLANASSADANVRRPAEEQLKALENENFPQYVAALCDELRDSSRPNTNRQLAGLLLKNTMTSKDTNVQHQLQLRWTAVAPQVRNDIRKKLLEVLGAPMRAARATAALVIAKVAACELPRNEWPDLLPGLLSQLETSSEDLQQTTFEVLGYLCEESPTEMQQYSSKILTSIAKGMSAEQSSTKVRLAATTALGNALEFARQNMAVREERDVLISMLGSAAQDPSNEAVRIAALNGLVKVASQYYEYLPTYMDSLFQLTTHIIKNDTDECATQAIEFWSSIADVELDIIEAIEEGDKSCGPCHNVIRQALPSLLSVLLQCLFHQSEFLGDETWNRATAAGLALSLVAQTVRDDIVKHVVPFVEQNFTNENWRHREAATLAFGSILVGPSPQVITPLVQTAFPMLLQLTMDGSPHVRDTSAWTLGRVCDTYPQCLDETSLSKLIECFLRLLKDEPSVAGHVCFAIHALAEMIRQSVTDPTTLPATSPLSNYNHTLIAALLETADRAETSKLLTSAYEAMNALIGSAAQDSLAVLEQLLPTIIVRYEQLISSNNMMERNVTQLGLISGCLAMLFRQVSPDTVRSVSDRCMMLLLQALQLKNLPTVQEEALMAIGALIQVVKGHSNQYMNALKPHLLDALQASQEWQLCQVGVGVVSDLCRSLSSEQLQPHCDEIVTLCLQNLQNPALDRSVKPHIITCLADLALCTQAYFERYLAHVMDLLMQATQTTFPDPMDYDTNEYLQTLRLSLLEAFTGILAGLADCQKQNLVMNYVEGMVRFLHLIAQDMERDERVLAAANGLIGDMAHQFGGPVAQPLSQHPDIVKLVMFAKESTAPQCADSASWAEQMLTKHKMGSGVPTGAAI